MSPDICSEQDAELSAWVDDVADHFEAAWQALTPPQIMDFLGQATGARRLALLAEVVKLDIAYRHRLGEKRQVEDYLADFPELRELWPIEGNVPAPVTPTPSASTLQQVVSPPTQAAVPLPQIRGYEILEELGHGGMGVVYKARQVKLNRLVAFKMILLGAYAGPQHRARFRAEAEAAARLQHPNIVITYDVGEEAGRPYCAMEYVDGGSLAQRIAGAPQPTRQAAQLVETLARAVQYAHEHGIVHRDLKPANILLVSGGVASGESSSPVPVTTLSPLTTPKIADFGLAKQLLVEPLASEDKSPTEALGRNHGQGDPHAPGAHRLCQRRDVQPGRQVAGHSQ